MKRPNLTPRVQEALRQLLAGPQDMRDEALLELGRDFKLGERCAGSAVGAGPGGQKGLGWRPGLFAQRRPAPAPPQPCG